MTELKLKKTTPKTFFDTEIFRDFEIYDEATELLKDLIFEIVTNTLRGNARFSKNKNVFAQYDKSNNTLTFNLVYTLPADKNR